MEPGENEGITVSQPIFVPKIMLIYVSGSECIGRCGQLPLKGSASSDLASVCEDCCNKKLDSNCVLVLLFQMNEEEEDLLR